ncbi:MAG: redoxin domain-containing protein [Kangiellaceae bacterium]|nr:redoxin domain-containing protein [Kangiellaceae bacterium]
MTTEKKPYRTLKHWLIIAAEITVFAIIFFAINWWQQRHQLSQQDKAQAPSINLIGLDNKLYSLPSQSTDHLVYFFAPWCTICDISIGNIEDRKNSLAKKGYDVFYVALSWQSREEVEQFVKDNQLTFPVLLGTEQVAKQYNIKGFPTYYMINSQGQVTAGSQGYSTELGVWLRSL